METMTIKRITEVKEGKTYKPTFTLTDAKEVYESLAKALISKKINNCTYIKSIRYEPLYNGYQKIIITHNNNCRDIFIVEK